MCVSDIYFLNTVLQIGDKPLAVGWIYHEVFYETGFAADGYELPRPKIRPVFAESPYRAFLYAFNVIVLNVPHCPAAKLHLNPFFS